MTQQANRPRKHSHALVWGLILLLFLGELIVAAAAALWYTSDVILPGVQGLGVELGGTSRAEAGLALRRAWLEKSVIVHAGDKTWTLPLPQLGFQLDADAMAQIAASQGRTWTSLNDLVVHRQRPVSLEPIWKLDPNVATLALRPLVAPLETPAQDAAVRIVGAEIQTTPSAVGQAVDLAGGVADLEKHAAQVIADQQLRLTIIPLRPEIIELNVAAEEARRLLTGPIPIQLYDPIAGQGVAWQVTPAEIGSVLTLTVESASPAQRAWRVNDDQLKALLRQKSDALGQDRYVNPQEALPPIKQAIIGSRGEVKLRIYHIAKEYAVKAGETLSSIAEDYGIPYPWIQQANTGLGDMVRSGQKITIPSQDDLIPLPPVENKRIIVSMKDQKLQAFENDKLKWDWVISTGIPSSPTSPGIFQVQSRDPNAYANNWDLWMPWFVGFYRPVPTSDFMNGFHGFPKRGGTQLLWTNSLGKQVTYGCVLANTDNAKLLYDWAEDGVIVEVRR